MLSVHHVILDWLVGGTIKVPFAKRALRRFRIESSKVLPKSEFWEKNKVNELQTPTQRMLLCLTSLDEMMLAVHWFVLIWTLGGTTQVY